MPLRSRLFKFSNQQGAPFAPIGRGNEVLGGTGIGSRCVSKQEGPAREPGPACGMGKCERAGLADRHAGGG